MKIDPELEYTFKFKEGNTTTFVCKLGKELTEEEKQKVINEKIKGFNLKGTKLTSMNIRDRETITVLLRAFQLYKVDIDYTVNYIMDVYYNSRTFNIRSFKFGLCVGIIIGLLITLLA